MYKADFEAEKQARTVLKSEKDQLADDLQNLQRRNQQLQEEVEIARGARSREPTAPPVQQNARVSSVSFLFFILGFFIFLRLFFQSPVLTRYSCPLCSLQFRSLKLIQEHVEICGTPPN